jgi:WD40 repeat protein
MLWDVVARIAVIHTLVPHDTNTIALSAGGKLLAIGTQEGSVIVRASASGRQVALLRVHSNPTGICALAFSFDGTMLAASSGDPALVTIWDVASGQQKAIFNHSNGARGIAFSPDGKTLAAANWQGRVYLWDVATKTPIACWWAHRKPINYISFSPDGRTLVTYSDDGTLKLWNVATRREMVTLIGPGTPVYSITFSPDGTQLAALTHDSLNRCKVWIWEASSAADADATPPSLNRAPLNLLLPLPLSYSRVRSAFRVRLVCLSF